MAKPLRVGLAGVGTVGGRWSAFCSGGEAT